MMDNQSQHQDFERLESNVERMISMIRNLKSENQKLKEELFEKDEVIKDFQNSTKITKLVESTDSVKPNADKLKERIEENIRIIDNCIAQLGDNVDKLDI